MTCPRTYSWFVYNWDSSPRVPKLSFLHDGLWYIEVKSQSSAAHQVRYGGCWSALAKVSKRIACIEQHMIVCPVVHIASDPATPSHSAALCCAKLGAGDAHAPGYLLRTSHCPLVAGDF